MFHRSIPETIFGKNFLDFLIGLHPVVDTVEASQRASAAPFAVGNRTKIFAARLGEISLGHHN